MKKIISYSVVVFFTVCLPISLTSAVAAPVSIMPLGDSITAGSSSGAEPGEEVSYRKALRDKLVAAGYEIVFVGSQNSRGPIATNLNHEGHSGWCASGCYQNRSDILREVYNFLASNPPDIVLLHIGTNDIGANHHPQAIVSAVSGILDTIFRYGSEHNRKIWVILALIIGRLDPPCLYCLQTTTYNNALRQMAQTRIQKRERILLVDMQNGAGLDYRLIPAGDMWDVGHPYETGYQKMANVWFDGLKQILIPSGKNIYQEFRASRTGSMRYFDGEKGDPSPIRTAEPSPPPLFPAPTSPAQPPAFSAEKPIPTPASEPGPAEGPKAAREKEPPSDNQASQPEETQCYAIQVNAFRDLSNAEEFVEAQKKRGQEVYLRRTQVKDQGVWYRVYLGCFADKEEAARNMEEKKLKEFFPKCFIQKLS